MGNTRVCGGGGGKGRERERSGQGVDICYGNAVCLHYTTLHLAVFLLFTCICLYLVSV